MIATCQLIDLLELRSLAVDTDVLSHSAVKIPRMIKNIVEESMFCVTKYDIVHLGFSVAAYFPP